MTFIKFLLALATGVVVVVLFAGGFTSKLDDSLAALQHSEDSINAKLDAIDAKLKVLDTKADSSASTAEVQRSDLRTRLEDLLHLRIDPPAPESKPAPVVKPRRAAVAPPNGVFLK